MAPWAAASVLLTAFILTMCRDLYWYDSAELAIAAVQPGLSHPPGQPLHTLLGWLLSRIVPGDPLLGLNLLSALCAALTAIPAMRLAVAIEPEAGGHGAWIAAAVVVGLGLGNAVWDSATRVEVYSLACLLSIWQIAHLVQTLDEMHRCPLFTERRWLTQGLLLGLQFATHPYIAIYSSAATVAASAGPLLARPGKARSGLWLLAGCGAGMLPYAWIPLAGLLEGSLVWGDVGSLDGLVFYLSGVDYTHNRASAGETLSHCLHFAAWLTRKGLLPALLAGLAGWWLGLGASSRLGAGARTVPLVFLAGGILSVGWITGYRPEIPDFLGYLLPATWLAGAGLAAAAARFGSGPGRAPARLAAVAVVGAWIALNVVAAPSLADRARTYNRVARQVALRVLADAPENAILLVQSDHLVFPILYLTEVEGRRTDVVVINQGWASSSWYWRHVMARHPELEPPPAGAPDRRARTAGFLARNSSRPVVAENLELASLAGGTISRSGWTLRSGEGSEFIDPQIEWSRHGFAREELSSWLHEFGGPGTIDSRVLAFVAMQWADDERAAGHPGQAVLDYLSGSTPETVPDLPPDLLDPGSWPVFIPGKPPLPRYELMTTPEHNLAAALQLLSLQQGGRSN